TELNCPVDWEPEELGRTLSEPAHSRVEGFVPASHSWFVGADEDLSPQEEAGFFLFDHEILQSAAFNHLAEARRFHKAEVGDDSVKSVGETEDFSPRGF